MTEITTLSITVGAVTILASVLGRIIDKWISYIMGSTTSAGKKNEHQEIEIAVLQEKLNKIETNDLAHIKAQLDSNINEHFTISNQIARIETKLDIIMNEVRSK